MGNPHYGEFKFSKSPARPTSQGYAKGGKTKGQAKVAKVMGEFKAGDLHSGSKKGPVVKDPKQAIAIALSEKKAAGYKKGGEAKKEPKEIVKQEIALLKKADAPAKIIKHEERELTEGYAEGGDVTPATMMKDRARRKEMMPVQQMRKPGATLTERERLMLQIAKEKEMDRKMKQAEKDQLTNRRMLDEAMNPLSMIREMYDRATDRSGESAVENMKRYGMKKGGDVEKMAIGGRAPLPQAINKPASMVPGRTPLPQAINKPAGMKKGGAAKHDDVAKDKPMVKKMIHKHEKAMHPGKPLTKMKKGGVPVHNRNAKIC